MSIDADFNAGLIDEETARQKRIDLQKENDFTVRWMVPASLSVEMRSPAW